jgi:hypothetical protein
MIWAAGLALACLLKQAIKKADLPFLPCLLLAMAILSPYLQPPSLPLPHFQELMLPVAILRAGSGRDWRAFLHSAKMIAVLLVVEAGALVGVAWVIGLAGGQWTLSLLMLASARDMPSVASAANLRHLKACF